MRLVIERSHFKREKQSERAELFQTGAWREKDLGCLTLMEVVENMHLFP